MFTIWDLGFGISDWAGHTLEGLGALMSSAIRNPPSEIVLAWRPFLDPAPIDRYWLWLLPPLILVIALVYRTIKSNSLSRLPKEAGFLALQISVFMVLAAAALWLLLLLV